MSGEHILVVDDEEDLRDSLVDRLAQAGYEAHALASAEEALEIIPRGGIDLVITDMRMEPRMDGITFLEHLAETAPEVPAIVLTAYGTIETAVAAMKAGAKEFLVKGSSDKDEVRVIVRRVLDASAAARAAPPSPPLGREVLGASPAMRECRDLMARASKSKSAIVLLRGESGSGKEVAARTIHGESARAKGSFVPVVCSAIPDTLIEAALFGYEKGAFTGAAKRTPGVVELAEGGTLLLDEIGDVPLHIQVKLLRLLAEKTYTLVGGTEPQRADVRFMAATHRDLQALVATGKFREDLFYRINVLEIVIPPLRERPEDVAALAERFCATFAREDERSVSLHADALTLLARQSWPGNVRQLQNFIERLLIYSDGDVIGAKEVQRELDRAPQPIVTTAPAGLTLEAARREAERQRIVETIARAKGNRTRAARLLEISRRSLYDKLEELDIAHRAKG
jgi:DNA-binding NtrC family response regulator